MLPQKKGARSQEPEFLKIQFVMVGKIQTVLPAMPVSHQFINPCFWLLAPGFRLLIYSKIDQYSLDMATFKDLLSCGQRWSRVVFGGHLRALSSEMIFHKHGI